jgi:hypothetical protein
MNRVRSALVILLILVAVLAAAAPSGAKSPPDLVVTKVSKPPVSKIIGSKLPLAVTIGNKGGAIAAPSKLGLYLGKGKKHAKRDKRLKRVKVKPLLPGKAKKLKLRLLLPKKTKPGTYRLFVCADDTRKVKEAKEKGNCRATKKFRLRGNVTTNPISLPASPPPAPAFTMGDGIDWGYDLDAYGQAPAPGEPVTLTLTAANGIPGQAGYTHTGVSPEGFRSGNGTNLDFSGASNSEDDGQVTLQLPFAFPFGGVREQSISVSTNGWVAFGGPAWDFWPDTQTTDYRGAAFVVGELERGIMPYWTDLAVDDHEGSGAGSVREVVAPDSSWVAFQWDVSQVVTTGKPRRTFQLVLFPDGSFRFDYPGANSPGGNDRLIGYSLGTGASSADIVSSTGNEVPSDSLLFAPKALPAAGPAAPGEVTATLPKGSSLLSTSPGCSLVSAPAAFSSGLVRCGTSEIAPGLQASQTVTFAMPDDASGEHAPANFRLLGTYLSGSLKLTDGDEIDRITTDLKPTAIDITPKYTGPNLEPGVPATFEVTLESTEISGLDEPAATFELTNATVSSVAISGEPIECSPLGGTSTTCLLPSGTSGTTVDVTVIPSGPGALTLKTTAQALNAPPASVSFGLFP